MEDFPQLLSIYYRRCFPFSAFCDWLSYGDATYLRRREFSLTLENDIYVRFQSYADEEGLQKAFFEKSPHKIDIGAVYNHPPSEHKKIKAEEFRPLEKELVFDVDMTDYDDIRTCCEGANICSKCWPFMNFAMEIVDEALREDFGFEHIMWVYSGRRGVHCWVCDPRARSLSQEARSAIAEYLSLVKPGDKNVRRFFLNKKKEHPSVTRAVSKARLFWENAMLNEEKQDILQGPADRGAFKTILDLLDDAKLTQTMSRDVDPSTSSKKKWDYILASLDAKKRVHADEVIMQYTYPRLDVNVTKGLNHLLKSPFAIHPKTGFVCVPIMDIHTFDPLTDESLPNVIEIRDEFSGFMQKLSNYVKHFNSFVRKIPSIPRPEDELEW